MNAKPMMNSSLMQRLPAGKPDQWQAVPQSYTVTATALYVPITDDD